MLKKLISKNIKIIDSKQSWEEAIKSSAQFLKESNSINQTYIDKIISNVKELGPYICLAPNFAMPHARPEDGVNKMSMELTVFKYPVKFPKGNSAKLFITLASVDNTSHLEAVKALMGLVQNEMQNLINCTSILEIENILNKY